MIKYAIPALAAAMALSACGTSEAPADTATTTASDSATGGDTTMVAPTATETVVAPIGTATTSPEGSSVTLDGKNVDATIGESGVNANVKVK